MPLPIEDYALIGDCHTAALVGRDGSIDWLCLPRFDSGACFAALTGDRAHGRWLLAPAGDIIAVNRRYRDGTLILETEFTTHEGAVRIVDYMPLSNERWDLVRIVEGLHGRVKMQMELIIRFDYGSIVPWVRRRNGALAAIAGPDMVELHTTVPVEGRDLTTVSQFEIAQGQRVSFTLNYRPSHEPSLPAVDAERALAETENAWRKWSQDCTYSGRWHEAVIRSLVTLKALTYGPTGGIVAAPTTSLPEQAGGVRNWDYRYCWLRDATFTLNALLLTGFRDEAIAWREWLLRAAAGRPEDLQPLYSVTGERRIPEYEVEWLPGYGGARPVRVGNAASKQLQLDIYGEVMDTLHLARAAELEPEPTAWNIEVALLRFLESAWHEPDDGIWEIRGPRRHFTHSKIMAWVAFDRAVKDAEHYRLDAPVERWRAICDEIHAEVCSKGYDSGRNAFVQYYGARHLDASLLLIAHVGFLPPEDPRVTGTVDAIERELVVDGLVQRYLPGNQVDGLPPGEGTFLPCSFWLADALALTGRREQAERWFERLLALRNDVGLLSEEYDARGRRMLGNFPQALTHVALVNTAHLLSIPLDRAKKSSKRGTRPAAAPQTHTNSR